MAEMFASGNGAPRPERGSPRQVSVVIPVLNGAATLPFTLESLARQTFTGEMEVVVADNGSTDGTPGLVAGWTDRLEALRVVAASTQRGRNHAANAGADAVRGDFIVFCDADDVPDQKWVEEMAAAAGRADLVGGRLEYSMLADPAKTDHAGAAILVDDLPKPLGFLPYAGGGNLGIWVDAFRHVGGFGGRYTSGAEDVDLCWRAQLAGYSLRFAPAAVVSYRPRARVRGVVKQAYRYGATWPQLFRDYRNSGMRRRNVAFAILTWGWLLLATPTLLLSRHRRVVWLRRAAQQYGRLVASIRYRVLFL